MNKKTSVSFLALSLSPWLQYFFNLRLRTVLLLGFASGLPLAMSGSTLQAWYSDSGVDITTIGFLSLVGIPYVFKFLWAPWLDRFVPIASLGRRRGWIFLFQALIIFILVLMAFQSPQQSPIFLGFLALMLAFSSASQDIAFDAYRTDLMKPVERGLGAAFSVAGYRVAMLVSASFALILADYWGWQISMLVMAVCMLLSLFGSYFGPEPIYKTNHPISIQAAIKEPFTEFLSRGLRKASLILLFIVLYKFGDAFAGNLSVVFLLRGLGFSLTDVGAVGNTVGFLMTLLGIFLGGIFLYQKGLYQSLFWFGILQAITNVGFVILSLYGKSYFLMVLVLSLENLAGGMGTAAFVAFLMGLCNHRYSATQFALFSALAAVGRVFVGPLAGYGVAWFGWTSFFSLSVIIALPGMVLLLFLRQYIDSLDRQVN